MAFCTCKAWQRAWQRVAAPRRGRRSVSVPLRLRGSRASSLLRLGVLRLPCADKRPALESSVVSRLKSCLSSVCGSVLLRDSLSVS